MKIEIAGSASWGPKRILEVWRKSISRFSCLLLTHAAVLGVFWAHDCPAQRPAQGPISQQRYTANEMGYDLFWQDEFDGDALDPAKWEVRGVGPRALGFVSPEAVKVEDGFLKLRAVKKDGRILLGAVGTQNRFMTRYGFFECRAQLQRSPGIWGAFWIQSTEISKGEDPAIYGAEIDIMEFFRKLGTDIVSHNVHWAYGPHQKTTHGMQSYLKGVSEGFHTFALEWTPEKYVFFVDGYKFYEVTNGISNIKEYLILSMEIPSDPKDIQRTVFPDEFVVDYVRVYKKKTKAAANRPSRMGLTDFVYDLTPEAVSTSRKFVHEKGDSFVHHLEGVP